MLSGKERDRRSVIYRLQNRGLVRCAHISDALPALGGGITVAFQLRATAAMGSKFMRGNKLFTDCENFVLILVPLASHLRPSTRAT